MLYIVCIYCTNNTKMNCNFIIANKEKLSQDIYKLLVNTDIIYWPPCSLIVDMKYEKIKEQIENNMKKYRSQKRQVVSESDVVII